MKSFRSSLYWLLFIFPILAIAAAVIILISADNADSNSGLEVASMPSPVPVTFIPPTPLPTKPPTIPAAQEELLGLPAPEIIFTTLNDGQIHLHDLQGKVVFLNFWATWCVPCQEEMPALQAFQDEHSNVAVIAITDPALEQTEADIRVFVETYELTFPIALGANLDLFTQFEVIQLPLTFIVDPQGIIRYRHVGQLTEDDMSGYLSLLST